MASSSMPYIKLYTEMLDDHKLGRLPISAKWHFVALLLLAGECDAEGYLVNGDDPMTLDDIAWRLRDDSINGNLDLLISEGLLTEDDGIWLVCNFAKRQGRPQYEKRKAWRERKRRQREQEGKDELPDENLEDVTGESRGTLENVTGTEKEKEKEESKRKSKSGNAGQPAGADAPNQSDYLAIRSTWIDLMPDKPRPRENNKTLGSKVQTRMKDDYFRDNWRAALERAARSAWLAGEGFFDLGWFLKNDDNWQKCLAGNYDNKGAVGGNGANGVIKVGA